MTTAAKPRRRGAFGWIGIALFWGYNALMAVWLLAGIGVIDARYDTAASEAEQDAMAAGLAVGAGFIIVVWVMGAVVLGKLMLAMRGRTVSSRSGSDGQSYISDSGPND